MCGSASRSSSGYCQLEVKIGGHDKTNDRIILRPDSMSLCSQLYLNYFVPDQESVCPFLAIYLRA
jgi:hypothetical protein